MTRRLRLAFFSPLPPTRSGIADFNAALLPYLASEAAITLFTDQDSAPLSLPHRAVDDYPAQRDQYDLAIYHIGNNSLHRDIYAMACCYPGLTVLHDLDLRQFISHRLMVEQANTAAFIRELAYEEGLEGYEFGQRLWLNLIGAEAPGAQFNKRLLRRSLGVVVHNKRAETQLLAAHPDRPIRHIPLLINQFPDGDLRQQLNLPGDSIIFATIGQLNKLKQVEWSLEQFAVIKREYANAHFLLVGEALTGEIDIPATIARLGLEGAVHHVGYIADPDDFRRWTAAADVVVALREPTLGETSAAALNGLAAGKPLIVFDQGWYGELPATVAVKVPAMDPEAFQHALRHFLNDPAVAVKMGQAGRRYVRVEHRPERVAAAYFEFIDEVLAW